MTDNNENPVNKPAKKRTAKPTTAAPDQPAKKRAAKPAPAAPPAVANPAQLLAQALADTPAAPWLQPTPEQQAAAQPVTAALADALATVKSPADAEKVLDKLEAAVGDTPTVAVAATAPAPPTVSAAADEVQHAAEQPAGPQQAAAVLAETARVIEQTHGPAREALAQAVQDTLDPEQLGGLPSGDYVGRRELLRQVLLHRLKPANALDANLFLHINHLPHNRLSNGFFHFLTFVFNAGGGWYVLLGAAALVSRKWEWRVVRTAVVPLVISTAIVEYPVKSFFRRRRPFIDIVRAIVVGKKPGTWSFPSGHAASAFAGAWLLRQSFPKLTPLLYTLAGLVGFSRVYLGDHYPGDVVIGSVVGHGLAQFFHWLFGGRKKK